MSRRLVLILGIAVLTIGGLANTSHAASFAVRAVDARDFVVQGSVNQVVVTGASAHSTARLENAVGTVVARKQIDRVGSGLFRDVPTGEGYIVEISGRRSTEVTVVNADATPPASFYTAQHLSPGFGYLKTRDGTLLSINVRLPGPAEAGPYPTVVEYSGYDPSNPNGRQPASSLAQMLGFATVGVNLRGTGCSGGAWDYFEPLQSLDGYDVIETVAAQPWVSHGKVGMVGISYPGITQLFVAQTRPPHLAAIAPLSVIDDTYATLYPGGIFNNGFALGWAKDRQADAKPSGQRWTAKRIAAGDEVCRANQALRLQAPNVLREIKDRAYYDPVRSGALAPATFVHGINVPVFLAGSWQDEETGSHFAEMLGNFAPGIPLKVTVMNGVHADALGPAVISRWVEFLDFYVARTIPSIPPVARAFAATVLPPLFGAGATLEPDRFTGFSDYGTALAAYEAEPSIRVLFDVGAGTSPGTGTAAGAPVPGFEATLPSWPPPATTPTTLYFGAGGTLANSPPVATTGSDHYDYDPAAFPRTDASSERSDQPGSAPEFNWKPLPAGKAVAYVSAPLARDQVLLGTGSVDLWLRSSAPDVDVEVTISEIGPDRRETYVQSGWLRASRRKIDAAHSSALLPVPTYRKQDVAPLPHGRFTLVRVPIYPFGHVLRAGSRLRIVVQPPGGNRPAWAFDTLRYRRTVTNEIARSAALSSRVVLPVISGIAVPTPRPGCGALRGQPCRRYVPARNASN
ncbi:MAG TPA: CocE/NonD family hydrolase [Acidimicrobiia bacterium]